MRSLDGILKHDLHAARQHLDDYTTISDDGLLVTTASPISNPQDTTIRNEHTTYRTSPRHSCALPTSLPHTTRLAFKSSLEQGGSIAFKASVTAQRGSRTVEDTNGVLPIHLAVATRHKMSSGPRYEWQRGRVDVEGMLSVRLSVRRVRRDVMRLTLWRWTERRRA